MNEFFITTIVGIATGVGGWLTARKRNQAETRITELDVVEKAITVWRNMSDELQKRYDELQKRYDLIHQQQLAIELELDGFRRDNEKLSRENKELIKKLKKYQPNDGTEGTN